MSRLGTGRAAAWQGKALYLWYNRGGTGVQRSVQNVG